MSRLQLEEDGQREREKWPREKTSPVGDDDHTCRDKGGRRALQVVRARRKHSSESRRFHTVMKARWDCFFVLNKVFALGDWLVTQRSGCSLAAPDRLEMPKRSGCALRVHSVPRYLRDIPGGQAVPDLLSLALRSAFVVLSRFACGVQCPYLRGTQVAVFATSPLHSPAVSSSG